MEGVLRWDNFKFGEKNTFSFEHKSIKFVTYFASTSCIPRQSNITPQTTKLATTEGCILARLKHAHFFMKYQMFTKVTFNIASNCLLVTLQ